MAEEAEATQTEQAEAVAEPARDQAELEGKIRQLQADLEDARSEAAAFRHERNEIKRKHETEEERRNREMEERQGELEKRLRGEIEAEYVPQLRRAYAGRRALELGYADPDYAVWKFEREHPDAFAEADQRKFEAAIDKGLTAQLEANPDLGRGQQNHRPLVSQGGRSEQSSRPREKSWLRG